MTRSAKRARGLGHWDIILNEKNMIPHHEENMSSKINRCRFCCFESRIYLQTAVQKKNKSTYPAEHPPPPHPNHHHHPPRFLCAVEEKKRKKDNMLFLASPPLICIPMLPRKEGTWLEGKTGGNAISGNLVAGRQLHKTSALSLQRRFQLLHNAAGCGFCLTRLTDNVLTNITELLSRPVYLSRLMETSSCLGSAAFCVLVPGSQEKRLWAWTWNYLFFTLFFFRCGKINSRANNSSQGSEFRDICFVKHVAVGIEKWGVLLCSYMAVSLISCQKSISLLDCSQISF